MADEQRYSVKGDQPLGSGDEDKLGFREVAKRITTSLVDHLSDGGLVVGLNGAWGSGKSSLLFLIEEELGKLPVDRKPSLINFRPWLIGNRDALITNLFSELSQQLDQLELEAGNTTRISSAKAKKAAEALRSFMGALGKAGSAIEVAGDYSGYPLIKWIGKGFKAIGECFRNKPPAPQLSELKENLAKSLRELGHRFIITIDDVDRLEPAEAIEILRLVRSVVDLPNVIYLLCYDIDNLVHSIEKAASVEDGRSYLEKIVQLTVMVPKPEPFQLRQWFSNELQLIASPKDDDEYSRLKSVIDYEGSRQLRTPRSVVRGLDAVRFNWPPLREEKADLADLVWLQLIKEGNPKLYRWIEDYCATASVVSLGVARVDEADKVREHDALFKTVATGYFNEGMYRHHFSRHIPSLEPDYTNNATGFIVFSPVRERDLDDAIRNRRLASPDHYRLYFALSGPSHALTRDNYTSMWAAAEADPDQAGAVLLRLHDEPAGVSLTKADLLLERIKSGAYENFTPKQSKNLLVAMSQVMDEAYQRQSHDRYSIGNLSDRAMRLVPLLLSRLDGAQRDAVVKAMFSEGAAISWLTSLFRRETFAHGRYGDRLRPKDEWLFTDAELNKITELLLVRYRAMPATEVFRCSDPHDLLFAWRQAGDEEGPRELVKSSILSNEDLVKTLEQLTSTGTSSDRGVYEVLMKSQLEPFMDYEEIGKRVKALKEHNDLGARATKISIALDDGAHR